jgi:succinyl-diaminopimelate desuccinylase
MSNAIQLLRDMIAIPSVNPMRVDSGEPVEREMADFIQSTLTRAGIDCERQTVTEGRDNVIGIVYASGDRHARDGLMLNSHMDTVPVQNMSIKPFDPVTRDGCVFGRGSCDAKASLAAMLSALMSYAGKNNRRSPVVFAAMADEEFSFSGSWKLIEKEWPVSACVVGEPTRLQRVIAHKGIVRWRITVDGVSAHGATPERGKNAVYDAARVALALEEFSASLAQQHAHDLLAHPTLNVGRIAGGQSVNIVPDRCVLEVERRLLPGEDARKTLADCALFVREKVGDKVQFSFAEPYLSDPAMETPSDAGVIRALGRAQEAELGSEGGLEGANYGTDGSKLSRAGIQTVVCGPGDIAQAHTAAEYVEIEQVELATRMYTHLLSNWHSNGELE